MKKDRNKLEMVLLWVSEQEGILKPAAVGSPDVPPIASEPVEGAELRSPEIESTVHDLLKSYSGKIVVNGKHHLERFIQLLILVKDLYDPGKPDNPLFTQFSTNDLAAVLRQIKELRELQVNTLQKKIRNGEIAQYNFILVVGQEELEGKAVNVRNRDDVGEKKTRAATVPLDVLIERLSSLKGSRSLSNKIDI